jgi:hypothetical protein
MLLGAPYWALAVGCALASACGGSTETGASADGSGAGGGGADGNGAGGNGAGEGGAGGGTPEEQKVASDFPDTSFDVVAVLDIDYGGDNQDNAPLPTFSFSSYFAPTEDGTVFVCAVEESVDLEPRMTFVEMNLDDFQGSFSPGTLIMPTGDYGYHLDVRKVSVTPFDEDGDDLADRFTATLRGKTVEVTGGDVTEGPLDFVLELQGSNDETAPQLLLPAIDRVHPMSDLSLWSSEALLPDTTVTLIGDPDLPLTTPTRSRGPQGTLIEFSAGRLSWFSGKWTVDATGRDLSGNPLLASGTIRTIEDPGIFPQDGFEGTLVAHGGGALIDDDAISGAQSLTLHTFTPATFHLVRNGGDTVRFSFREERFQEHLDGEENPIWLRTRVLVVGTQNVVTYDGEHSSFELDATVGSVVAAEIPLEAEGEDVIVAFDRDWDSCIGSCGPVDVVIDDLRIE